MWGFPKILGNNHGNLGIHRISLLICGGFPKMVNPQVTMVMSILSHDKSWLLMTWMIWGYPHFRKHIVKCPPYQVNLFKSATTTTSHSSSPQFHLCTHAMVNSMTLQPNRQPPTMAASGTGRHDEDHITDRYSGAMFHGIPPFYNPSIARVPTRYICPTMITGFGEKRESDGRTHRVCVGPLKIAR